jgi:SAM-dependent methyltransferase
MTTSRGATASNVDRASVEGFGEEWSRFDQRGVSLEELRRTFEQYFAVFPWDRLPESPIGFDMGCGSGRWARFVAPRVAILHCIDASDKALAVARQNLGNHPNCVFHLAAVGELQLADRSMDFGFSLGVLHHVPDTAAALRTCVDKLKPGAPFLVYLYYAFDNRPEWFRTLWAASDVARFAISRLPAMIKHIVADTIAACVYWPLARWAAVAERRGLDVSRFPLSFYRHRDFYTMRTDALDRFGTRLEQRFTRDRVRTLMEAAGLMDIRFSSDEPYWCAVGVRRDDS